MATASIIERTRRRHRGLAQLHLACLLAALVSVVATPQTLAFGLDTHEQIVRGALAGQMSADAVDSVVGSWWLDQGNRGADRHQLTPSLHFDSAPDRLAICDRWRASIDTLLDSVVTTSDPTGVWDTDRMQQREAALQAFGRATHALADFYSHSNYVELAYEHPELGLLDDWAVPRIAPLSGDHCDPNQLPAGLQTGYFNILDGLDGCPTRQVPFASDPSVLGEPSDLGRDQLVSVPAPPAGFAYCHEQLAKDEPDSGHGADHVPNRGTTYYQVATLVATKATRALWDELRQRFRGRVDPNQWDADCLFDDLAYDRSSNGEPVGVRCRVTIQHPAVAVPPSPDAPPRAPVAPPQAPVATPQAPIATPQLPTATRQVPAATPQLPAAPPQAPTSGPLPAAVPVSTAPPAAYFVYLLGVNGGIGVVVATAQDVATRPSCEWSGGGLDCRVPAPVFQRLFGPYASVDAAKAALRQQLQCGTGYWGPFAREGGKFYWLQNNVGLGDCKTVS